MALAVRILEELAKKGYKLEPQLAAETTQAVEGLAARAKLGKLEPGNISFREGTAINKMTETLLSGMKRADGTLSRSAVLDLHQAYASAAIKEFGRGAGAEQALESFTKTVSTTWKETRPTAVSDTRLSVAAAERDARRTLPPGVTGVPVGEPRQTGGELRNYRPPQPTRAVVEVPPPAGARPPGPETVDIQFREVVEEVPPRPAAAAGGGGGGGGGPRDPHDHTGHATSEEIAARARMIEEDRLKIVASTWDARAAASTGLREFDEGGYAAKKAAFDKIVKIEGSGWLARPGSAEAKALNEQLAANPRSLDEVRQIILSRPGMDEDGKFIGNLITTDEWTELRKGLRGEVAYAEQTELVNALDVARQTVTTDGAVQKIKPEDIQRAFTRLRAISDDPDYQAEIARRAAAKPADAATEGTGSGVKRIQADLLAGRPVERTDLNRLEAYYNTYHTDGPAVARAPGLLSQATSFVTRGRLGGQPGAAVPPEASRLDRFAEWEYGRAPMRTLGTGVRGATSAFALAAGVATVGTLGYAVYQGQDVFFDPDQADSTGKRWGIAALTMGPGDWLKSDSGTIKNLYSQAIYQDMQRDQGRIQHWLEKGNGSPDLSPAVAEAIAAVNQSQTVKAQADKDRSVADKERLEREVAEGNTRGVQGMGAAAGGAEPQKPASAPAAAAVEKGVSVTDAEQAVVDLAIVHGQEVSFEQMQKLSELMTQKAKSGSPYVLSQTEYAEVKQDSAYKGIPVSAQKKLDEILAPKMTP